MAQSGKKNLALFQALRKKMAAKAKATGNIDVPNLQESVTWTEVRAALLGPRSSSGTKGPESGLIELPETSVMKDIDINLPEIVINSIESMEPDHLVKTMVEFGSKALILSRRVGFLYRREVKEGSQEKV